MAMAQLSCNQGLAPRLRRLVRGEVRPSRRGRVPVEPEFYNDPDGQLWQTIDKTTWSYRGPVPVGNRPRFLALTFSAPWGAFLPGRVADNRRERASQVPSPRSQPVTSQPRQPASPIILNFYINTTARLFFFNVSSANSGGAQI